MPNKYQRKLYYFQLISRQNILDFFRKKLQSDTETFLINELVKKQTIKRQNQN